MLLSFSKSLIVYKLDNPSVLFDAFINEKINIIPIKIGINSLECFLKNAKRLYFIFTYI